MSLFHALIIFNCSTLCFYGVSCLFTRYMQDEFKRYGLPQFRIMTGILELLGSIGIMIGLYYHPIGLLAALGLSTLLLCGFRVRVKIKDGILKSSPAFIYFLLNAYLAFEFILKITSHS